jgi:hypothetical protein
MSKSQKVHPTQSEQIARYNYKKFDIYFKFAQFLHYVDIGEEDECWEWKGATDSYGYGKCLFKLHGKRIQFAHVASYEFFIGRRHGLKVCHSCDNPICVNPNHLWLGTQKQNVHDMMKKGRREWHGLRGEDNWHSKLTMEQVKEIKKLYKTGKYTQQDLADKFKVSSWPIYAVLKGKTYRVQ